MNTSINRLKKISRIISNLFNQISVQIANQIQQRWSDILIALILAIVAALATFWGEQLINRVIVDERAFDVWFESDAPRVFSNMTARKSNHYRTKVHPLFSLIAFPPVFILTKGFHIEPLTAVRMVIAGVAAIWMATLFILLRLIGCRRTDAIVFSILAATTAAAIFWFVVPETYSFGSVSILLGLCFVAISQYRRLSPVWCVLTSAATLSMTTTNWMTGILATIVNYCKKQALQITANALCLVVVLWTIQKIIFPSAEFFLGDREEQKYTFLAKSGGVWHIFKSFVFHTIVMPAINIDADKYSPPHWPIMETQLSLPGSGSLWGKFAVLLWTALLSLGLWGFFSTKEHPKLRIVLGLTLLGNLALHSVYGEETFLYSLHFAPLLVVLAAFSTFTRARTIALVLAGMLALTAGANNSIQFQKARAFVEHQAPQRYQVLGQMELRPQDPWPRGIGHVVLATPGSSEAEKAYHEPGGSFSPGVGSFGVSVWLTDQAGKLQATSDNIPINEIEQHLSWDGDRTIPGILTQTKYYQTLWSATKSKDWQLNLKTQANTHLKPILVIRSPGPAGGPINSLNWDGNKLLINHRFCIAVNPPPAKVYLGEETHPGWSNEKSQITKWEGKNGWGYARLELSQGNTWNAIIQDCTNASSQNSINFTQTQAAIELNLPDKQFTNSLNAQVAHLMMGLVNKQTRPGEPINYPSAWLRDGAYQIVALARAGQLQVAKELSTDFAQHDFFGGFGPEADGPGLSIWALEEVVVRLKEPAYDQQIWPHVRRKVDIILKMLQTKQPIYQPTNGPIVPQYEKNPELTLVAEPAKNGLIVGRMDWQRPVLYINAVSYRGLLCAAAVADRVKQPATARQWRDAAAKLQQAWEKAFQTPKLENDRTYISGLWPTWIAVRQKDVFAQALHVRWQQRRDRQGGFRHYPEWTYFDIAEAHQWLFVNQLDRVWTTLRWFWNHQASPGLYTWWEGNGEENSFRRWEQVRGWVKPQNVTPHYWSASEMLLLQLDMLAYTYGAAEKPTVAIGAGIPQSWLKYPMSVQKLPLPNGKIDWLWDGQQMQVKIFGDKVNIRLGSAFPPGTPVHVEYI